MKSNKNINAFLIFLALAIFGVSLNYFAFARIKAANLEISAQENAAEIAQGRIEGLFGEGDDNIRAQINELRSRILSADGAVAFFEMIEKYAESRGVALDIKTVTIDQPADQSAETLTETLRINIEAEGAWTKINELIFYLEHLPYRSALEYVALSKFYLDNGGGNQGANSSTSSKWRMRAEISVLKAK